MRKDDVLNGIKSLFLFVGLSVAGCTEGAATEGAAYEVDDSYALCPEQVGAVRVDAVSGRLEWLLVKVEEFPLDVGENFTSDSRVSRSAIVEFKVVNPENGYGFSLKGLEVDSPTTERVADFGSWVIFVSRPATESAVAVRHYFKASRSDGSLTGSDPLAISGAEHYATCVTIPGKLDSCEGWFRALNERLVVKFTFLESAVLEFDRLKQRIEDELETWECR